MRPLIRHSVRQGLRSVAVLCLVLLLVVFGSAACGPQQTELAVATEVVDDWVAAWNASDPHAVAAVFAEDAVYQDIHGRWIGRDEILDHALYYEDLIVEVRRIGEGRTTGEGTFVFRIGFDFDFGSIGGSGTDEGEVEVSVGDRLLTRVEWLTREQVG